MEQTHFDGWDTKMTIAEMKKQAIADFRTGQLSLLALTIILAILDVLERAGVPL